MAETYPLPDEDKVTSPALAGQPPSITGQSQPALATGQTSTPPPPGVNATGPSPLSEPTQNESQGGGVDSNQWEDDDRGSTQEKIDGMVAGEVEEKLSASADHVSKMTMPEKDGALSQDPEMNEIQQKATRRKVGESMSAQGANPRTALEKLRDKKLAEYKAMEKKHEITPKQHGKLKWHWKNIFNKIPEEDFGLVLMDFGFRAMMAGETMGDAAAIGAAGSGALAGVAARKEAGYQRDVEQHNMATEGALTEIELARTPPETRDTEGGIQSFDEETQTWKYDLDDDGERVMPSSIATRPPVDKWKIEYLKGQGWSDDRINTYLYGRVTEEQVIQDAESDWAAFLRDSDAKITIGRGANERVKRSREVTPGDKAQFLKDRRAVAGFGEGGPLSRGDSSGAASDGALTNSGKKQSRTQFQGTDDEYAEYVELYDQYGPK